MGSARCTQMFRIQFDRFKWPGNFEKLTCKKAGSDEVRNDAGAKRRLLKRREAPPVEAARSAARFEALRAGE